MIHCVAPPLRLSSPLRWRLWAPSVRSPSSSCVRSDGASRRPPETAAQRPSCCNDSPSPFRWAMRFVFLITNNRIIIKMIIKEANDTKKIPTTEHTLLSEVSVVSSSMGTPTRNPPSGDVNNSLNNNNTTMTNGLLNDKIVTALLTLHTHTKKNIYIYTYIHVDRMKLVRENFDNQEDGRVVVIPAHSEDLWTLYNVIRPGNGIKSRTVRKIKKNVCSGSTSKSERKILKLALRVTKVEFDPLGDSLRISGTNLTECEFVRLGAYHTSEVELRAEISIRKTHWDQIDINALRDACDDTLHADLAAIAMEEGLATVCLVTPSMCNVKSRIEFNIQKNVAAAPRNTTNPCATSSSNSLRRSIKSFGGKSSKWF